MQAIITPLKKAVAVSLLLLLSFLQVAKALHRHSNNGHPVSHHSAYANNHLQSCDICDFHLAKDAGLPSPVIIEHPNQALTKAFTVVSDQLIHSSLACPPGRGPPVFI